MAEANLDPWEGVSRRGIVDLDALWIYQGCDWKHMMTDRWMTAVSRIEPFIWSNLILLVGFAVTSSRADDLTNPIGEASTALQIHDGFQFRAVAHEPLVVDPVSVKLDMRGRLWVVEMPDYPLGAIDGEGPNGRIKILEDVDHDGLYDRFDLFAEGLDFATGVQPFRDGAFVTLAGHIVFMRDRDGDNRSDETVFLFRGFAEQNQQLRANHPTLGPDGLVYVAGGLRGGKIESMDPRYPARDQPLDIRDRDFAFDPDGGWWGAVAGKSQFGMTIDDFGRRIGCSNRNPAMTPPLNLAAVDRDPLLAARDAVLNVSRAAEQSKVVSRAEAWTTSNLHSGQFSAACGVLAPGAQDAEGEWLLVCEPTAYLVQMQRLSRQGSVWEAERVNQDSEFLASSDSWFRPVDLAAGPASSVFVVDMARAVIEHPDFMPPELKTRPDQRDGDHLGRIWQVSREGAWPIARPISSVEQACRWLQSQSPWQREAAFQFLLESEQKNEQVLGSLVLSDSAPPQARSRAAWLLHHHKTLTDLHIRALLAARDPRLRALAVELTSGRAEWVAEVAIFCDDMDPLVRRQAALAMGAATDHPDQRADALVVAAWKDPSDAWINRTIAASPKELLDRLARGISSKEGFDPYLLGHLTERLAMEFPAQAAEIVVKVAGQQETQLPLDPRTIEMLQAWLNGNRKARRSVTQAMETMSPQQSNLIRSCFNAAAQTAESEKADASIRARCLSLAIAGGVMPSDLRGLFAEQSPPELRVAVLGTLMRSDPDWMRDYLEQNLTGMSIRLRGAALAACASGTENSIWLLDRIAEGSIPKTMIDPELAKRFRQHPNAVVAAKAKDLLQQDPNRAKVLANYRTVTKTLGDPVAGKRLFAEHCSACHHIDGVGTNVGPDISDTRTKSADALLISILDPNAAIDSAFVQFQVLTTDGRILDGLLIDETVDAVTLQQKGGERVMVPRDEIDRMRAPGVSLMPEGFERTLDQESMSHLISFLKNWRYLKTSIPGTLE